MILYLGWLCAQLLVLSLLPNVYLLMVHSLLAVLWMAPSCGQMPQQSLFLLQSHPPLHVLRTSLKWVNQRWRSIMEWPSFLSFWSLVSCPTLQSSVPCTYHVQVSGSNYYFGHYFCSGLHSCCSSTDPDPIPLPAWISCCLLCWSVSYNQVMDHVLAPLWNTWLCVKCFCYIMTSLWLTGAILGLILKLLEHYNVANWQVSSRSCPYHCITVFMYITFFLYPSADWGAFSTHHVFPHFTPSNYLWIRLQLA